MRTAAERQPCPGVKRRNCYFDAERHWKSNRAGYQHMHNGLPDDELRQMADRRWRHLFDLGLIPPACPKCGFHHR